MSAASTIDTSGGRRSQASRKQSHRCQRSPRNYPSLSVGGDAGYMQISVPVHPGNSGGALLNRSGDVVGVVMATASALTFLKGTGTLPQNVSWAVKGAFAVPLFDQPPPSARITDRGAVVRRAVKATCSVTASAEPN